MKRQPLKIQRVIGKSINYPHVVVTEPTEHMALRNGLSFFPKEKKKLANKALDQLWNTKFIINNEGQPRRS